MAASFAGSADYAAASKSVSFTIRQATPNVSVTDASGVYNGSAYTATATVAVSVAPALFGVRFHSTGGGPIPQGYEEFCTENPTNGNVTVIGTAPSVVGVEQGESALDAAGHRYFFLGSDGTGTSYVYVMNTQTGQQIAALAAGFSGGLQFDPSSGDLFGLRYNFTQKVEEFCTRTPRPAP